MACQDYLQGQKESLPFFAPEIGQDGGGCDWERQRHHDASLTQTHQDEKAQQMTSNNKLRTQIQQTVCMCVLPCGSSGGTASVPQRAGTLPGPEQSLDIHQKTLHKAASSNNYPQTTKFDFMET